MHPLAKGVHDEAQDSVAALPASLKADALPASRAAVFRRVNMEAAFVFIGTEKVPLGTTELDLSDKGLTALPESIGKLQALTKLIVYNNKLDKIN